MERPVRILLDVIVFIGNILAQALRCQSGTADLIVAHPFDGMQWIRLGHDFTPGKYIPNTGIKYPKNGKMWKRFDNP
nr:hypothetical protein [uncultured Gellertiella sp.]